MMNFLRIWQQMFGPSAIRREFLESLQFRDVTTTEKWDRSVDAEFAESILRIIEDAGEWPRKKILPSDKLTHVFHGPCEADMPFSRFSYDLFKLTRLRISAAELQAQLDIDAANVGDFMRYLYHEHQQS
jgi:hypothetical protein